MVKCKKMGKFRHENFRLLGQMSIKSTFHHIFDKNDTIHFLLSIGQAILSN